MRQFAADFIRGAKMLYWKTKESIETFLAMPGMESLGFVELFLLFSFHLPEEFSIIGLP